MEHENPSGSKDRVPSEIRNKTYINKLNHTRHKKSVNVENPSGQISLWTMQQNQPKQSWPYKTCKFWTSRKSFWILRQVFLWKLPPMLQEKCNLTQHINPHMTNANGAIVEDKIIHPFMWINHLQNVEVGTWFHQSFCVKDFSTRTLGCIRSCLIIDMVMSKGPNGKWYRTI